MNVLVIDLETTGFDPRWARVCEIGAVLVDTDQQQELAHFECLIEPDILDARAEFAFRANGLGYTDLIGQPGLRVQMDAFMGWILALPGTLTLTAFNVPFDRRWLERSGFPVLPDAWSKCIMRASTGVIEGSKASPKLATLASYFSLPCDQDHRALSDARLASRVLFKLGEMGKWP